MEKALSHQIKDFNDFKSVSKHFGIEINNNQLILFKKYYEIITDWNQKINLISRRFMPWHESTGENNPILEKHFLDSILFLPETENLPWGKEPFAPTVFDIGSGGGFPAIPLAIMKPEWKFTLCESTKKKAIFLTHLIKELGLEKNVNIINNRVEACYSMPLQSNMKFNIVTVRAVDKLDVLIKYALPLLKPNGYLLAYKSKDFQDEINNAQKIIDKNKLLLKIYSKELNGVERRLVVIRHCEESA